MCPLYHGANADSLGWKTLISLVMAYYLTLFFWSKDLDPEYVLVLHPQFRYL